MSNSRSLRSRIGFWNAALSRIDNESYKQGFACCRCDVRSTSAPHPAQSSVRYRPRPVVYELERSRAATKRRVLCTHGFEPSILLDALPLPGLARCSDTRRSRAAAEPSGIVYPLTRPSLLSRRSFRTRAASPFRYVAQSRSDAATRGALAAGPGSSLS